MEIYVYVYGFVSSALDGDKWSVPSSYLTGNTPIQFMAKNWFVLRIASFVHHIIVMAVSERSAQALVSDSVNFVGRWIRQQQSLLP
jgi:hypothetical protein